MFLKNLIRAFEDKAFVYEINTWVHVTFSTNMWLF